MPTQLILSYTAYAYATVPNDIARKMKDGTIDWWSKWGDIYYIDEKGEEQKIDGHEGETDYKRHEGHEWDDEVESEDEEEEKPMDGDGFVICTKCEVGGGKCRGECDEEESDEDDDDTKSVHSTCCVECGESFKFDVPVSAEDYHNGKHDQHCPSCQEESEDEEDCLAGNPKCVKCKIYLSEDDMAVWNEDTTKEPMCESCLDEEESESESEESEEETNSGVVWKESACEGPCGEYAHCCYRSYKFADKVEAMYRKPKPE